MKESMKKIIDLVEIQSPIPNFDGDDKGISCGLLPTFNIARERLRIVEGANETKRARFACTWSSGCALLCRDCEKPDQQPEHD
jgi:hypothetical protein